jgi:hypothetical protein
MGSTALSQTLQNRSQNMNTSQNHGGGGGDFALKSWNHISAGDKTLMRTETTAVSDTGSEEYILRRDANGGGDNELRDGGEDEIMNMGKDQVGITRTVVVRIQSAPNVIEESIPRTKSKTGGTRPRGDNR